MARKSKAARPPAQKTAKPKPKAKATVKAKAPRKPPQDKASVAPANLTSVFTNRGRSGFERITRERFYALAMWGLSQDFRARMAPASYWSADGERVLAVVYDDPDDNAVGLAVIARDPAGRYRPFGFQHDMPTVRAAEDAIKGSYGLSALDLEPNFKPLSGQPAGVDFFSALKRIGPLHPAYQLLISSPNQSAARALLAELGHWTPDRDGNLVKDFQTAGFSARIWELYLAFAFRSLNLAIDNTSKSPDFCLRKGDAEFYVEATTVNGPDPMLGAMGKGPPPPAPKEYWDFIDNVMPLKFGSPLHTKMQKRYWEMPHVKGRPFMLACADFHAPASMTWSHTAVPIYLYGRSALVSRDANGRVTDASERLIESFDKRGVAIKPFFHQPESEHVSAVVFSNAGTLSKFNRMGVRAGYGDRFVRLIREGVWNDPSPGAFAAIPFKFNIESPLYDEGWADELEIYHNPNALVRLDETLFPGVAHFHIERGEAIWRGPSPRILFSKTTSLDLLGRASAAAAKVTWPNRAAKKSI